MDEQRMQAYVELIEQLLGCPQGQEAELLQANAELLDTGLLKVTLVWTDLLEQRGDERTERWKQLTRRLSKRLEAEAQKLQQQLNEHLLAKGKADKQHEINHNQLIQPGEDEASDSSSTDDWARFLRETLQLMADRQGNPEQIYQVWIQQQERLNATFLEAFPQVATRLLASNLQQIAFVAARLRDFGNLIQQFPLGNRALNLELGIAAYEQAMQVYTRDAFPEKWAMTHSNLANAYSNRIRGERADNLERAIVGYEQALQFYTRDAFPYSWATVQNNLMATYYDRIRGERADNLEHAIVGYEQSLQVYTREAFPEDWAMTQTNLALVYSSRIRGERSDNLERAIVASEQAMQVYTRDAFPEGWARAQNNLAGAYLQRLQGERADNLERAIASYEQALQVYTRTTFPEDWAMTQNNLVNAYLVRIRGERTDNLERAIVASEQAMQVYTRDAFPERWALAQNNLANAYSNRIRGDRAANIEQAIAGYDQALQVYTFESFPEGWARAQNNLAGAYLWRIRGEQADNLERAIVGYEQALQVYTCEAFPEQWAMTQTNLTITYSARIRGERADNLERAITACEQALRVYTHEAFPEQWAMTQNNLALALSKSLQGEQAENLDRAVACYEQALKIRTCDAFPEDWAGTQTNLANAYNKRIRGDRAVNIEQAIMGYEQALKVYTREAFPEQWALTQNALGAAYVARIRGTQTDNLRHAIEAYEKALQVYTCAAFPKDCRRTAQNLGMLHWQEKSWKKAINAYQIATAAAETLYQSSISYAGKSDEIKASAAIYRRLAYAQAQLGHYQAAIITLEQGRTRGLSESLDRDRADLAQLQSLAPNLYTEYQDITQQLRNLESRDRDRDRMVSTDRDRIPDELIDTTTKLRQALDQTIAQIRQVPGYEDFLTPTQWEDIAIALRRDNPLIYLVTTTNGGMALIVTVDEIEVLWLNDLTETKLIALLTVWFTAYDQSQIDRQGWYDEIDTTTRQLWNSLMSPLVQQLKTLGIDLITLIPTGYLSLLPLHAAWTPDPTKPTGRRYALDDIHFTYAPNAKSLTAAQDIVHRTKTDSMLAIHDPTYNPNDPIHNLKNAEPEVQAAIASFGDRSTVLKHSAATIEAVKLKFAEASIVHFACHGKAELTDPLTSGLEMSDGRLTHKDILALNLTESGGLRLAILSACETGMIGLENADEAISLPTGLLQAGVAAVIASLWSVSDLSTMLLLTKFYYLWRTHNLAPDQALRQAQLWLRDSTDGEKADELGHRVLKKDRDKRTYAAPYHWAAFSYTGL
jgi:CHAT domain-containing protein